MYEKFDAVKTYRNKNKTSFHFFLFEMLLEDKRWIHANPTIYAEGRYKDKYQDYYACPPKTDAQGQPTTQCEEFYQLMHDKTPFVILQGKRGSGKTSFLNYILNRRTRDLNDAGYTWIRIDTTKIYKNEVSFTKKIDFEDYLYAQLLFVYFRYRGGEDTCQTPIRFSAGTEDLPAFCAVGEQDYTVNSCDPIFAGVQLRGLIGDNPELLRQYKYAEEEAAKASHFNNSFNGKCFDCNALGKILYEAVKDKLILIIDGIDNISYNSNIRHDIWIKMTNFLTRLRSRDAQNALPLPHKVIVALRDENCTILRNELDFLDGGLANAEGTLEVKKFNLTPVEFLEVTGRIYDRLSQLDLPGYGETEYLEFLKSFLQIHRHGAKKYLQKHMEDVPFDEYQQIKRFLSFDVDELDSDTLEHWLGQEIFVFSNHIVSPVKRCGYALSDEIEKALAYKLQQENLRRSTSSSMTLCVQTRHYELTNYFDYVSVFEENINFAVNKLLGKPLDNVLIDLFNNDLRELFILSYKSYASLLDFARSDREANHYGSFIQYAKNHYIQITRSVFRNGNRYAIDRGDIMFFPPYRNISFINLFNILNRKMQRSDPLYAVYLLKYLYEDRREPKIMETFGNINKKNLLDTINVLLEFGYIDINYVEGIKSYKITTKGKTTLLYSLKSAEVMNSYVYGGLVESRYRKYFQVYTLPKGSCGSESTTGGNYASVVLFNLLLLWHSLQEQARKLGSLGIECDIIPERIKQGYRELLTFPEEYIYSNIKKYIKPKDEDDKKLINSLKEQHRQIMFEGAHYDKLIEDESLKELLQEKLSVEEKIIYVRRHIDVEIAEILDSRTWLMFVFDSNNISDEAHQKRQRQVREVLEGDGYWSIRAELNQKLDALKKVIEKKNKHHH